MNNHTRVIIRLKKLTSCITKLHSKSSVSINQSNTVFELWKNSTHYSIAHSWSRSRDADLPHGDLPAVMAGRIGVWEVSVAGA